MCAWSVLTGGGRGKRESKPEQHWPQSSQQSSVHMVLAAVIGGHQIQQCVWNELPLQIGWSN